MTNTTATERRYETLIASDVINAGVWLELWDVTDEDHQLLASVFHSDMDDSLTFHAYQEQIPFYLVERLVLTAKERLLK